MKRAKQWFTIIGPGIAVAATGVGAGDMVAAAVSGAKFGTLVLWAAIFGAVLKFVLNEGIARWQLATGKTLLEGWSHYFGRWVSIYFLIYLLLWSFIVAGALIAACGLAAHAIFPELSVSVWGIIHSLLAVLLILIGRYALFETLMKFFIGMMFLVMVSCALWIQPGWMDMFHHLLIPTIPKGAGKFLLGVIGGVGGSVTLLNYGYWIREKGWQKKEHTPRIRTDLGIAYGLTGFFGFYSALPITTLFVHVSGWPP